MANCGENINIPKRTVAIPKDEKKDNRCKIMKWLIRESGIEGMTPERAAGLCGNIFAESNYNPNSVNPDSGAYGICQWLGDRQRKLKNLAASNHKQVNDLDLQLAFLKSEINGSYKASCWNKVLDNNKINRQKIKEKVNNLGDDETAKATWVILRFYEVPGRTDEEADAQTINIANLRVRYAKKALEAYNNGNCTKNVTF